MFLLGALLLIGSIIFWSKILKIGDELSRNHGMAPPQVSYELQNNTYYKPANTEPHTLVSDNGLKTIAAFSLPGPSCPREDSGFTVDLLTFKELGEYKLAVNTHFLMTT